LFLHLDYNANFYGRILLNSILGENNFRNEIIWAYRTGGSPSKNNPLASKHDTIFYYSKSDNLFFKKFKEKVIYEKPFFTTQKDENGNYYALVNLRDIFEGIYTIFEGDRKITLNVKPVINVSAERIENFLTQKPEGLLKQIILLSTREGNLIMDFFSGTGTTLTTAHKMKRKWIGVECEEYFEKIILPRMKEVLAGRGNHEPCGISEEVNWQGGGFFKYYELEQFEDTLRKAVYKPKDDKIENIEFNLDIKLAKDGLEIDYEKKFAKYTFEKLYPDVDIPETISNLIGKKIKKITRDKVVFEDDFEVDLNNLTFEKYPFLKPLIWWE